jgi:hypothetical protein
VVRVLATAGGGGVRAVLLPLREDGAPTGPEEAILDAAVWPGGPGRRWARILAANPPGGRPFTLVLAAGAVTLETPEGRFASEDLAGAVAGRAAALSPHRLLDLKVAHAHEESVEVPPGGFVRALVAFPAAAEIGRASGATIEGGVRLLPRDVATEGLRAVLADGRVDALADARRAEAPGEAAPGREAKGRPR